jgi:hypothetical protein
MLGARRLAATTAHTTETALTKRWAELIMASLHGPMLTPRTFAGLVLRHLYFRRAFLALMSFIKRD